MGKNCVISKKSESLYTFTITYGTVLAVVAAMLLISCPRLDGNVLSNVAWILDKFVDGFVPTTITFVAVLLLQQFLEGCKTDKEGCKTDKKVAWFVAILTSIIIYSILYIAAEAMTSDLYVVILDAVMIVLTLVEIGIIKQMVSAVFSDATSNNKNKTGKIISG